MAQLDNPENPARWSAPDHCLITVILMRCGLRIGDALRLSRDCMVRDGDGAPYLRYFLSALLQPQDGPGGGDGSALGL
jgi:hypothetical protein